MTKTTLTFYAAEWVEIYDTVTFIKNAHQGQRYGDLPYWNHPVQVANTLVDPTVDEYLAALLHDVVEDTGWSLKDLAVMYRPEVIEMVKLLTKDDTMTYRENIQRIIDSGNKGAMRVKLADNRVNNSGDKSQMKPERRDRLNRKYAMSIDMLEVALGIWNE